MFKILFLHSEKARYIIIISTARRLYAVAISCVQHRWCSKYKYEVNGRFFYPNSAVFRTVQFVSWYNYNNVPSEKKKSFTSKNVLGDYTRDPTTFYMVRYNAGFNASAVGSQ
jgi:hypothetical protein